MADDYCDQSKWGWMERLARAPYCAATDPVGFVSGSPVGQTAGKVWESAPSVPELPSMPELPSLEPLTKKADELLDRAGEAAWWAAVLQLAALGIVVAGGAYVLGQGVPELAKASSGTGFTFGRRS